MKLLVTTQIVDSEDPILGFFHAWLLEFSKHFSRIDVICLKEGVHTLPSHVFIHSLGKEDGENDLKYLFRFYRYFMKIFFVVRVDYVFFHMGAVYNILAAPFFLIRKFFYCKFLWWKTHGKVGSLHDSLALLCVDTVLTAGSKSFDMKTNKVRVVGHAIDPEQFIETASKTHEMHTCLMVGRIVPIKKIEVAVRACAQLSHLPIRLVLVGSPDRIEYETELKAYIETYGMHDRVMFLGSRTQRDVVDEYKKAGILLHPAYEAGFDKAVLEAMASGVIPLTSITSFKPILEAHGLFVPPEDDTRYAEGIQRIIDSPEEVREKLRSDLRNIVIRDHSLRTLPKRIFGV